MKDLRSAGWGVAVFVAGVAVVGLVRGASGQGPATTTIEGRTAASVPAGPNDTIIATDGGVPLYETQRIKRTPPLDPAIGLDGNWDALYTVKDGSGFRTSYFDWDSDNLYLGVEMPDRDTARFDLDLKDDGWLRGADNLTFYVSPLPEGQNSGTPKFAAYRFDTVQNRDQPVWAMAPIPLSAIRIRAGRTPRGTYAVVIAVARTEDMGLERKPGALLGVRCEGGNLPDPATEPGTLTVRPMLRLTLADAITARTPYGVSVRVALDDREVSQAEGIKATLEVRNDTTNSVRVGRMFLKGALSSASLVDSSTYAGADLLPGKSIKRELKSSVGPSAPLGASVFAGGVDLETGGSVASLASFDRVEPYGVSFDVEARPVHGAGETPQGDTRTAKVIVKSRAREKAPVRVALALPEGWKLTTGKPLEERSINFKGDVQGFYYKFLVPAKANPGQYNLVATVEVGGKTYRQTESLLIAQ